MVSGISTALAKIVLSGSCGSFCRFAYKFCYLYRRQRIFYFFRCASSYRFMYDSFTFFKKNSDSFAFNIEFDYWNDSICHSLCRSFHNYFFMFGFYNDKFASADYYPVFPWHGLFVWYCVKQTFLQGKEKHFQVYNQRKSYRFSWKKFAFNIFDSSANNIAAVGNTNEDFCMNMAWCLWQK